MLYLAMASEVSGTTGLYIITAAPEHGTRAMLAGGLGVFGGLRRRRGKRQG